MISAELKIPNGVNAQSAKLYYVNVSDLSELYEQVNENTTNYIGKWYSAQADIMGNTVSAELPEDAVYCYFDVVDSQENHTAGRLIKK